MFTTPFKSIIKKRPAVINLNTTGVSLLINLYGATQAYKSIMYAMNRAVTLYALTVVNVTGRRWLRRPG